MSLKPDRDIERTVSRRAIEKRDAELIRREASAALSGAGGSLDLLLPILMSDAKILETHNGVVARYRCGDGWGDVNDAIRLMKLDPDYGRAFTKQQEPNLPNIPNPWSSRTFNLTVQMRLKRENPELAARLQAAADL